MECGGDSPCDKLQLLSPSRRAQKTHNHSIGGSKTWRGSKGERLEPALSSVHAAPNHGAERATALSEPAGWVGECTEGCWGRHPPCLVPLPTRPCYRPNTAQRNAARPGSGPTSPSPVPAVHLQAHHRADEPSSLKVVMLVTLGVPFISFPGRVVRQLELCHILWGSINDAEVK